MLVGMSVNLTLSPQSLWSFKNMTNTWRIHKACQILFGRLKPCCWFALLKSFCLAVCLIKRPVSTRLTGVGVYCIGREGHWRIYWRGNQWLSCQADACSSHSPSQDYWKGLMVFDYCLGHFYPWKASCTLMCVSFRPAVPIVCWFYSQKWRNSFSFQRIAAAKW